MRKFLLLLPLLLASCVKKEAEASSDPPDKPVIIPLPGSSCVGVVYRVNPMSWTTDVLCPYAADVQAELEKTP